MRDPKFHFEQACMDETLFVFNDSANVRSSLNNINSANGKGTVVVYRPLENDELDESGSTTLQNIIAAVKIDESALIRINSKKTDNIHVQHIINSIKPSFLICFGISPGDLGIHIETPRYTPFAIQGISMLFCDAVEKLDKPLKNRLWAGLQKMYVLK